MRQSLGIVEVQGLVYTVACADAALKAANVTLLGYEPSKGGGFFVLKFLGNVGAVRAALDAALALAKKNGHAVSGYVIPRPSVGCWDMVNTENENIKPEEPVAEETDNGQEMTEEATDSDNKSVEELEETCEEVPEEPVCEQEVEVTPEPEAEETSERPGVCNICKDPKCPRRKNEPHHLCIHFEKYSN